MSTTDWIFSYNYYHRYLYYGTLRTRKLFLLQNKAD